LGRFRLGLVGLVHGMLQVQNLCAYLATGGMPVSVGHFGYSCDSCELEALDYCGYSRCVVMLRYGLGIGAF
jgi:hypothetical protein